MFICRCVVDVVKFDGCRGGIFLASRNTHLIMYATYQTRSSLCIQCISYSRQHPSHPTSSSEDNLQHTSKPSWSDPTGSKPLVHVPALQFPACFKMIQKGSRSRTSSTPDYTYYRTLYSKEVSDTSLILFLIFFDCSSRNYKWAGLRQVPIFLFRQASSSSTYILSYTVYTRAPAAAIFVI